MSRRRNFGNHPQGVFCQLCFESEAILDEEDVVPIWLRGAVRQVMSANPLAPRGSVSAPKSLLLICKEHNSKMAKQLENYVADFGRAMVSDQPVMLVPAQQSTFITWAAKTELLLDLWTLNAFQRGEVTVTRGREDRDELTSMILELIDRAPTPEPGWVVRLARTTDAGAGLVYPSRSEVGFVPAWMGAHAGSTTVASWGHLVIETTLTTASVAEQVVDAFAGDPRFVILHVNSAEPIKWPPPSSIDGTDLVRLRSDWGHGTLNGWSLDDPQAWRRARSSRPTVVGLGEPRDIARLFDHLARQTASSSLAPENPHPGVAH